LLRVDRRDLSYGIYGGFKKKKYRLTEFLFPEEKMIENSLKVKKIQPEFPFG